MSSASQALITLLESLLLQDEIEDITSALGLGPVVRARNKNDLEPASHGHAIDLLMTSL